MTRWVTCNGCGQLTYADDGWIPRGLGECCRLPLVHEPQEPQPLFESGPAPMPGQFEAFNPDERNDR